MGTHGKLVIRMTIITRRPRAGGLESVEHAKSVVLHSQYCEQAHVAGL
jgi:hypothetical protein